MKEKLVSSILAEIQLRSAYLENRQVGSVYFGGGTPSLLNGGEITAIMQTVKNHFELREDAEVTLEANPDDLSPSKFSELKAAGINRLSIGVQSFYDADLQWMNRAHNARQSVDSIMAAKEHGFDNITIDLIYGIPNQSFETWKDNLERAVGLGVSHLSCYALTVEPKTALYHQVEKGIIQQAEDEEIEMQFNYMTDFLHRHDFEHYEISNFARGKKYAVHNSSYWKGNWYLGLGPSAHSFNGLSRQWNIDNNLKYIHLVESGDEFYEIEILKPQQRYNEFIMTSLRTMWGLDVNYLRSEFQVFTPMFERESSRYLKSGYLLKKNDRIVIAAKGRMIADKIISDLFVV